MRRFFWCTVWLLMFPIMLLIINPLNDITSAIRYWWEGGPPR